MFESKRNDWATAMPLTSDHKLNTIALYQASRHHIVVVGCFSNSFTASTYISTVNIALPHRTIIVLLAGIIKGVQYFTCAAGRGLMVRPVDVKRA